jgi:hypothetical protein
MAVPNLQKVVIDGVDVSSYVINWVITETLENSVRGASVSLKNSVANILVYESDTVIGKEITISRGSVTNTDLVVFRGYVRQSSEQRGVVSLTCEDKLSIAKYVTVNASFLSSNGRENGVVSEIFKTLITSYTSLSADGTSIQNSGSSSSLILNTYRLRQRVLIDGLQELATAIDWQYYYDPVYDKVFFEPKGFRTSSTILSTQSNIVKMPKWEFKSDKLFNQITVVGSAQTIIKQEGPYKLDGTTAGWSTTGVTLAFKPVSVKVLCDTGATPSTEKKGGVPGMDTGYAYSVDKTSGIITWNTSTFAPTTAYYATIQYTYEAPIIVTRSDAASISQYTGGSPKAVTQVRDDLQTTTDVANWAKYQLRIYSTPFVYLDNVSVLGEDALRIGYLHTVDDPITGYSYQLMIKNLTMSYPYKYDVITLTDQDYRCNAWAAEQNQRLRRLEEQNSSDTAIINTFTDVNHEYKVTRRHIEIIKQDLTGSGTITGTSYTLGVNWVPGAAQYQTAYSGAQTTVYRFPGDNYFQEMVYDTKYYDAGSSTGVTWDTGAKTISISGRLVSNAISIGPQVTACIVTLASDIPYTTIIEVSNDGGANWTTVTRQGTRTPIPYTGTVFLYRITNTAVGFPTLWGTWGSSNPSLTNSYNANGTIQLGAINISLEVA